MKQWIWIGAVIVVLALFIPHVDAFRSESSSSVVIIHASFSPPETELSMAPIGPQSTIEDVQITIPVIVTAASGTVLKYTVGPLPDGAYFDSSLLAFIWTPSYYQAGTYQVTFSVTDGITTKTEIVSITVNDPLPTFLPNPYIVAGEGTQRIKIGEIKDPDTLFTTCEVPPEQRNICHACEIIDGIIYLDCTAPPSLSPGTIATISVIITDINNHSLPPVLVPVGITSKTTPGTVPAGGGGTMYSGGTAFVVNQNTGQFQTSWLVTTQENGQTRYTIYRGLASQAGYTLLGSSTDPRTGHTIVRIMDADGNVIEIETTGLVDQAGQIDGVIEGVAVITAPTQVQVKKTHGKVSAFFRYQIGNCGLLSKIKTEIEEAFDASVQEQMKTAVDEAGYVATDMPFIVRVSIEPPCRTGNSSLFLTVNAAWVYEQLERPDLNAQTCMGSGIEPGDIIPNLVIVHIGDNGEQEVLPVQWVTVCPDLDGNVKVQVNAEHLSIYGMVSVKAKETAGITQASNVAPMLVPSGVGFEAFLTENPAMVVGVVAFIAILAILEMKFHIIRRREHKALEHPEGGPPAWEGLIETDRQKALAGIIGVLNDVDAQLKDLDQTMAKRAPGFLFAPAEADGIVEKFFYSCQVAEEKIKTAAAEEHISQKQVDHLNGQLKDAVDRMLTLSQKSEVLAQAVQARMGTGTAAAGGET